MKNIERAFMIIQDKMPDLHFRDQVQKALILQRLFDRFGETVEIDITRL